jgi:Protein of unknown function (DUF2894)
MASHARLILDAWRESGADRLDPVRFHFMEALERRAAGYVGEARRVLDGRLSGLLDTYARDLESAASNTGEAAGRAASRCEVGGALAELVDYIDNHARAEGDRTTAGSAVARKPSYPELEALDYFRETWSRLSAERQLRRSLAQVPGNPGPLNSSSLVHRSLSLMRELSPGYLQQFLSYVDALSWMEQMNGGGAVTDKDAPRAARARKNARGKPRQR